MNEEEIHEGADDGGPNVFGRGTSADVELFKLTQETCNPKSEHLSPNKEKQNVPARIPEKPEVETRKTRVDPAERVHRVQQAAAKQKRFRIEGKTRLIDIGGQDWEIEKEAREKMRLGKDLDLYVTSEGRKIDWGDLGKIQDGGMIEVGFRMKGGRMKRKTKTGNHWESLASGGESEGLEEREIGERRNRRRHGRGVGGCPEQGEYGMRTYVQDDRDVGGLRTTGTGGDVALV